MCVNPPGSTGTQASPRPPDTVAPVNCRHPPAGHSQSPHTSTIRDPFLSHPQGITQHWEHCLVPCRVNGTRHTGTTAWVRMFHGFESHCSQPPPPGPFRFPASHLGAEAFLQSGTAPAPRPLRTRSGTGAGTALCFRSWSSQESRGFADTHCCSDSRPGSCTLYGHTIGAPASYSNNIIKYYGLIHY